MLYADIDTGIYCSYTDLIIISFISN